MKYFYIFAMTLATISTLSFFSYGFIHGGGIFAVLVLLIPFIGYVCYRAITHASIQSSRKNIFLGVISLLCITPTLWSVGRYYNNTQDINSYVSSISIHDISDQIEYFNGTPVGIRVTYTYTAGTPASWIVGVNTYTPIPLIRTNRSQSYLLENSDADSLGVVTTPGIFSLKGSSSLTTLILAPHIKITENADRSVSYCVNVPTRNSIQDSSRIDPLFSEVQLSLGGRTGYITKNIPINGSPTYSLTSSQSWNEFSQAYTILPHCNPKL